MSALHHRTVLVGVGEQEPSPSPPISRSTALRTSNLAPAAVDNRDRSVRSHSHYSHVGVGPNRAVEVIGQSQVVGDREGLNSCLIIRGKEDKKLAVDVKKKGECRPEDIDECAEAFIRKFRQQLQIQRLESLENYEQMLARGL